MMSNHSEDNHEENYEIDDLMTIEQDEEQSKGSPVTFEYSMDDVPVIDLYLNNDDDRDSHYTEHDLLLDDDRSSQYTEHDLPADDNQSSLPDTTEISTALALFRHRHKLSKSCINDLCDLLRLFGVRNVPVDFRAIERNLTGKHENILQGKMYIVCPQCGNKGTSSSNCENVKCKFNAAFKSTPTKLCTLKLLPQITSILERHAIMPEPHNNNNNNRIVDVQDGQVRRDIVFQERILDPKKQIVTLLLNSDGIVLKKSSRSIWVTCIIINELPRAIRFNIDNIIICSVSMGGNKPKKDQFQSFIVDWVHELHQLQLGFYVCFPNSNDNLIKVHAYLIAAALDKPAQALLLNINDPTGYYSCVRCTIRG
jgi:hypothetical protein